MPSSSNKIKKALALTAAASIFATVGISHAASHVIGVGKEQGKKAVSNVKELGKNGAGVNPGLSKGAQGLKLKGGGLASDTWSEQGFKGPKDGSIKGPGSPKSSGALKGGLGGGVSGAASGFKGDDLGPGTIRPGGPLVAPAPREVPTGPRTPEKEPPPPKPQSKVSGIKERGAQLQNAKDGLKLKGAAGGLRNSGRF